MTTVLSGIQPTAAPTLGNYLGALRWWVDLQNEHDCFYCIVDLHALTVPSEGADIGQATVAMANLLLAAGLDPSRCSLFVQSHVPEHAELCWLLECTASIGELRRMTQFKDKASKAQEEDARVGLFAYPVLMAADILLYNADLVPVGDDQRQHLELTRDLAQRWNTRWGQTFTVPKPVIPPRGGGARIKDLQDPSRKMSKSAESAAGVIYLFDDLKQIEKKIKRAVTDNDTGPGSVRWDPAQKPGVSNLLEMLGAITGRDPQEVAQDYESYGKLKADVAESVMEFVGPLQRRYQEFSKDRLNTMELLKQGADQAREVAIGTLQRAKEAIGLLGDK